MTYTDNISLKIETTLTEIQILENDLKDVSSLIASEQDEIQRLRLKKEELTQQIEIKAKKSEAPGSSEKSGSSDFRHLLKKRNPPPPTTEKGSTDLDQKDFRNLLKKRN